ncbi:hypothetical protein, partial [Streptomyces sp. NRRL S-495]|uniref:hypothetical protein n=1 Tax=Streptomyces sp. NRRL S-495 TaxID=1609133 RepID=UPI00256FEA18
RRKYPRRARRRPPGTGRSTVLNSGVLGILKALGRGTAIVPDTCVTAGPRNDLNGLACLRAGC